MFHHSLVVLVCLGASWNSARQNSTADCPAHCSACSPPSSVTCLNLPTQRVNLKASPSRWICPALKWPPITSVGVSAKRANNSRRVAADRPDRNPPSTTSRDGPSGRDGGRRRPSAAPVRRPTGCEAHMARAVAGRRDQADFIGDLASLAIRSALPASAIGFTESLNTAILSGSSLWSRQCSYSVLPNT